MPTRQHARTWQALRGSRAPRGASRRCDAHRARRSFTSSWSVRASTSIVIRSPSRTSAIGPPRAASGETWPTINPRVAPLKRPSVTSTTDSPRPRPTIAEVIDSISGIPGAPAGPFVAHHDHIARLRHPTVDPCLARLLRVEHARRAAVERRLVACQLDHRALRGKVAAEHTQRPARLERCRERPRRPRRRDRSRRPRARRASDRPRSGRRREDARATASSTAAVPPAWCRSAAT